MVLQLFPQDFIVEDQPGHRDPRSMLAQRLEANAHLITGSVQEHNCLIGASKPGAYSSGGDRLRAAGSALRVHSA